MAFPQLGKISLIVGIFLCLLGLWLWLFPAARTRLPGDIVVEGKNYAFFFPLGTCLAVSVVLSILFWLFGGRGGR